MPRRRRPGAARAVAQGAPRAARHRDDGVRGDRDGGRGHPAGRLPLPDQAVRGGRARALPRPRARRARVRREARSPARALTRPGAASGAWSRRAGDARGLRRRRARRATPTTPVLIVGETGTGKRRTRAARSTRRARAPAAPFVAVNCAALPETLLESELFGHVKGAFTGATSARAGLFVEADRRDALPRRGGEMPPALQAKLLRVLEERRRCARVGADKEREASTSASSPRRTAISASARRAGAFREDLLYRLNVVDHRDPAAATPARGHPAARRALPRRGHARSTRARRRALRPRGDGAAARPRVAGQRARARARDRARRAARAEPRGARRATCRPPCRALPRPGCRGALGRAASLPIREVQRRYAAWALETLGGHKARTAEALGVDMKTLAKWLGSE